MIEASNEWKRKFFFQDFEILNKSIFQIFPNFSKDLQTKLDYTFEGLKDIQLRDEVHLNDGSVKKITWHISPWKNHKGDTVGVMLRAEDVTRIKQLEYELLQAKNLLKEKGEIAKIGSWEYEVQNEKLSLSNITKKIFNISKDSKISVKNLIGFFGQKESEELIKDCLHNAIEKGISWDESLPINLDSSRTTVVNVIGKPKFKNGKCNRIVGTVQIINDIALSAITEQETIEKRHLSSYFIEAPVSMALLEFSTGDILNINRELQKVIGYENLVSGITKNLEIIQKEILKVQSFETYNNDIIVNAKIDISDAKGKTKIYSLRGRFVNEKTQILCSFEDITERIAKGTKLKEKLFKSEVHAEKLVNFTHMICHNLKGHAINYGLMFDYLDELDANSSDKSKALKVLKHSTDNLSSSIKDLREMVTIRKEVKTAKKRLLINDFIAKAEQNLMGELKEAKAKILNEIPESQKIKAYPIFFENVLTNCISNAVKYRKTNKTLVITIGAEVQSDCTILSIEDNGQGMDLEKGSEKLFKLGASLGNNEDSRGMGLYFTKYQMDMLNGNIEVESKPGEGAKFKLFFPHN